MGNFYTNIVVKGPTEVQVFGCLSALGRNALVVSHPSGLVFVYDEEADTFEDGVIESLALTLALRLKCPAMAAMNYHDESLLLWLYSNTGTEMRFGWGVKCEEGEVPATRDQFSAEVRRLFGTSPITPVPIPGLLSAVVKLFSGTLAIDHHTEILHAGGIAPGPAALGYRYVDRGELKDVEPGLVALRVHAKSAT